MTENVVLWIAGVIVSGGFGIIGWFVNTIFTEIKEIKMAAEKTNGLIDDHKLYSERTFTTKVDIKDFQKSISEQLNRIESKLDGKEDKKGRR
jgi:hypothetical protein